MEFIINENFKRIIPPLSTDEFNQLQFADEEEAEEWIMRNQLGRRNLSDVARARIALKLKDRIAERAKLRQSTSTGGSILSLDKYLYKLKREKP